MSTGKLEESEALLPDSYESLEDTRERIAPRSLPSQKQSSTLKWVNLLLCAFVLADLVVFLVLFKQSATPALGGLEFRDTYIGLQALYGSGRVKPSPRGPIVVAPRIQTQVFSADPAKPAPPDYHRWLDGFGMLSSVNRHLQVSRDVRTVVQFRAMDFGMEKCALALRLPSLPANASAFQVLQLGDEVVLDVCKSDLKTQLDVASLSYRTRPACNDHVGTIAARAGEQATLPEFPCAWASYHTFEVSCARGSPDCLLDVWSNEHQTWGFVMYQYQTI